MISNDLKFINIDDQFNEAVDFAMRIYFGGGVFVYPTDTIYGFGGNPFNDDVMNRVKNIKGRDENKQFIFLINSIENLKNYVEIDLEKNVDFLAGIWPDQITVILNLNKKTKDIIKMDTAAFRIPKNKFCSALLEKIKMPLISTSVNKSGKPPLMDSREIMLEFGNEIDGLFYPKVQPVNSASTIIDLTKKYPSLIREGKIKFSYIENRYSKL